LCFPKYANKIAVPDMENAAPEVRTAVRSIITGLTSGELKTIRIFITTRQAKAMEINCLFLLLVTRLKA
jgi:hypothetical protein